MTKLANWTMAIVAGLGMSGAALADPALIYDLGGKFDKSFNEAAYNGAQRYAEETGGNYFEIELSSEAQREQALRRFAEAGANPVVTTGFAMSTPISKVAPDYPDTNFVTIDGWVDAPNVHVVGFAERQGSYLVGMLAAMASETGTVGFGVGYALDENNAALITGDMKVAVDQAREEMISGQLAVHDYASDDSCPVLNFQ